MNISQFNERDVAYKSFLYISCRVCGDIPTFEAKYNENGTDFELGFPDSWHVDKVENVGIVNVVCPKCSRSLKLNKIKDVLKGNNG